MHPPRLLLLRVVFPWLVLAGAGRAQTAGTALLRHAPTVVGTIDGSVQVLTAESVTLNSGAAITGDLFVPGSPAVQVSASAKSGGTTDGTGAALPAGFTVALNGTASVRSIARRTDPVALPAVAEPPPPPGTRSVTLNAATQSAGDFATLRHLTLSAGVGQVVVPPGSYGDFTANGSAGFTLGVAGATQPSYYQFQNLALARKSRLWVVGPVVVTLANGLEINGAVGVPTQPGWLTLNVAKGAITLGTGLSFYGSINAPASLVTINTGTEVAGGFACDQLFLNGGRLRVLALPPANRPPSVALTAPAEGSVWVAPAAVVLRATASDSDGTVARVQFLRGTTLLGEDATAPYELSLSALEAGAHAFVARAIDNQGAAADSAPLNLTVAGGNRPPVVALTSPAPAAVLTAPASLTLAADASDPDGTVARVEFLRGAVKAGEDSTPPYSLTIEGLAAGTYTFSARAVDQLGAATTSAPVTVTVVNPNRPPVVNIFAPPAGAVFSAPAAFAVAASATDPDGTVTLVELFENGTRIAAATQPPYSFGVNRTVAGGYRYQVRAWDDAGASTDSAVVAVTVTTANLPPTVELTAPTDGAVFDAPLATMLAAQATDADGTVVRVEFFAGATKLGEDAVAPFQWVWSGMAPGSYVLSARAYDNQGASTLSAVRNVTVRLALPFFTGFEATQGYVVGPLAGQGAWTATAGVAVTDALAREGQRAVWIAPSTTPGQLAQVFPPYTGHDVVFVDFFARLAASAAVENSSVVRTDFAVVGLQQAGADGELMVLHGDGFGGGSWQATGARLPLAADGQTKNWVRLTLRGDFVTRRWDLYADGRVVAADRAFRFANLVQWTNFSLTGHGRAAVAFDDFYGGFENPLFADADQDGMDDAWEIANGLNPALNDRAADRDGDGLANFTEFQLGTRANLADTDGDGVPDGAELALGRNPLAGAMPDAAGSVNLRLYTPVP